MTERDLIILDRIEKLLTPINDTEMVQHMSLDHAMTCIKSFFETEHLEDLRKR